jgi:HK97 family phage prohead protease
MTALAERLVDGGLDAVQILGEQFTSVTGVVVPYSATYTDVGWFLERFERGAFTASLVKRPDVPLLLWHDNRSFPVGVAEDWDDRADGLHGRFRLAMSAVAQVAASHIRDGFMDGMSVGFGPVRSSWSYAAEYNPDAGPDFMDRVTRHEARLHEVSLVSTPAYVDARVYHVGSTPLAA